MNFSYLNDRDELFFFPTDNSVEQIFSVQAINGSRYIISDHTNEDIISLVTAQRHNNDLHLTLSSASPTTMVVKDFYQTNGKVFTLNPKGEYQQHIAAQNDAAQGPIVPESQPAMMQDTQPEVASLKVIQRAETVQSLEQLATSLNLSDVATLQAPIIATPMAQPASLMALQEEATVSVKPSISAMYDEVGARKGMLYSGSVTDDKLPLIKGVGQPGATLEFFQNGELIGYTTVNQAGEWSFTFDIPLEEGGQLFYVRDPATSQTSGYVVLIIDTVAPDRAELSSITADNTGSIVAVAKNGYTNDNTPTFSGKGEANSMIAIYNDKTLIGTTYADTNGIWSFTPPYALPDGIYVGRAVAIDFSGNTGLSSAKFDFIIDTLPPAQPQIIDIIDNEGAVTGPVANGAGTDDSTPTLNGRAEAGSRVTIFDNGVKMADVQADASGNWTYTPDSELSQGSHTFTVIATDQTGNISAESAPWNIILVPGLPDAPVVNAVYDDRGETAQPILPGQTTADTTPLIHGSAEPDSVVIIYDNGEEIARVNTGNEGNWVFTPDNNLTDGEHALTFVTQNPAGNQSEPSDPWVVIVDATAPDAPVIGGVYDDVGVKQGELTNGDSTDDTRPTLNGTAEAGSVVAVYDNGEKLGETTADENGSWSFTPDTDLSEGEHSLTVTATDAVGNTSAPSAPWELVIDTTAPAQPAIDGEGPGLSGVTDDKGPVTGPIENGGNTDDDTPTFNGTGNPGDTVIITDNGNPIGEAVIDEDGTWTFTPETGLEDGEHEISVIIQDPAGNQSDPSDPWVVIVDTTAPDAPVIGGVYDDAGVKTGNLANGDSTDDTRPTLNGTAEAGSVVVVYDNGEKLGETTADENGSWSFTPDTDLSEGEHSLTVTATDAVGNTSAPSAPWELVIDTTAPAQPGIDGEGPGLSGVTDDKGPVTGPIENGGSTDDDTPTFNGTGNPGDTVIITDNGNPIGETVIDEDGTWTFTPETGLEDGEHEISVIIQDPTGNQSKPSDPWVVIVDATAPDAPVIGGLYDDVGSKTGNLGNGDSTDDTRPTLNGTAEAGSVVTVYDNGEKLGETTADENGNWSFTPDEELDAGAHSFTAQAQDSVGNISDMSAAWETNIVLSLPDAPVIETVFDDVGPQTGELKSGDVTDDRRPEIKGQSEPGATVILYDRNVEIGRTQADNEGRWSITPQSDLNDGVYQFTAVVQDDAGNISPASDAFEVVIYSGDGPTQIARVGQMGKDSGHDGNDFVTDNGDAGRLMYGTLSAELTAGQRLQVSTDGGRTWSDAMVEGTRWAAQDQYEHALSWNIQTRVVDQSGNAGFVMQQAVTLDVTAPHAPSAVQLDGTNLVVDFASAGLVAGDRLSVVTDSGAHRFEHTLTADDIAAGSVSVDVGTASTASAALIDMAGNQSSFVTTSGLAPSVNMDVKGDVSELYGQSRDNVFSVADVSALENVKVIEGNGGVDTLKLTGADQMLDLSGWKGRLSSIEVIDITGSGNNTLKLSLGDVLDQGHTGAFINDDSVQMAVKGNAGDVVMLSDLLPNGMDVGDWENLGEVVAAGVSYDVYHHSELGAELLIQQGITVQFS